MKTTSLTSGNDVFPIDFISKIKHIHIFESSVCKYVWIGEVALVCEKVLSIALSDFLTHFSGVCLFVYNSTTING